MCERIFLLSLSVLSNLLFCVQAWWAGLQVRFQLIGGKDIQQFSIIPREWNES